MMVDGKADKEELNQIAKIADMVELVMTKLIK